MIKGSLILSDSNICIYRTLSLIEPKILGSDHLEKTTNIIAELTNNNLACKIIVSDVVHHELKNDEILLECINDFCIQKLHWRPNSFRIQQIFSKAKKSIDKFISTRLISLDLLTSIKAFRKHLPQIDRMYLHNPIKLKEITDKKVSHLRSFDAQRKRVQRPNNLPEENDRLLLCQAIELKNIVSKPLAILSNDSDFLEFRGEIKTDFDIEIISIHDKLS